MSKLEDVKHRFEWDAGNFAAIYKSDSPGFRLFNRVFRKAVFARYQIAMDECGDVVGKNILDIGCGSGIYSIELAKRGGTVQGIDFSEPMLQMAREGARKAGVEKTAEFVRGEFLAHDFGSARFDFSIAMGVYDYLEDPAPFLAKVSKLTRGRVIASFPQFSLVRGTARRLRYRLTGRGDVFYYSPDAVHRLAENAGIKRHRLIRLESSGGGVVLVGDNS